MIISLIEIRSTFTKLISIPLISIFGGFCKIKQLAESKYDNVSTDYELAEKEVFYIKELETFEIQFEEI